MLRGVYINLDRKPDRRRRMEAELRRFKLASLYQRVSAVDGQREWLNHVHPAVASCFASHLKAIKAGGAPGAFVHVLEDDTILSSRLKEYVNSPACAAALAKYDLLFLDMWVEAINERPYRDAMQRAGKGQALLDLRGMPIQSADSYLVSPRGLPRVVRMLEQEVAAGIRLPVDTFYERSVKASLLTAAVVVPFLTCVDEQTGAASSIQELSESFQRDLIAFRTSFFVDQTRQRVGKAPPLRRPPRPFDW